MNTRNKEMKDFINEYREVLNALEIDIAHAELTDRWYLFKYNKKYMNYEFFFEIRDSKDLVHALLSELGFEMYLAIGVDDVDIPECEKNDISDRIEGYCKKDSKLIKILKDLVHSL